MKVKTTMGSWRARTIRKTRASRTTGRSKGLVPPAWAKACAKNARAYRQHPRYGDWCARCIGEKIKWSSK